MLSNLEMDIVFTHYQQRLTSHRELIQYFDSRNINKYVELALGITHSSGNYSAAERRLGPQVLSHNTKDSVFELAQKIMGLQDSHHIPDAIYKVNMPYLRISIGSEIAMMLNPDNYWVSNVRTIYSHLLIKHQGDVGRASEELHLYKEPDEKRPSAMEYKIWRDLYLSLENSLKEIAVLGTKESERQGAPSGDHVYMWADAISSHLYSNHA